MKLHGGIEALLPDGAEGNPENIKDCLRTDNCKLANKTLRGRGGEWKITT
jgi:hypothetical protein